MPFFSTNRGLQSMLHPRFAGRELYVAAHNCPRPSPSSDFFSGGSIMGPGLGDTAVTDGFAGIYLQRMIGQAKYGREGVYD